MLLLNIIIALSLAFASSVSAAVLGVRQDNPDSIRSHSTAANGLPPSHPLIIQQGFDPALIDAALRQDAANIIKAGYNLRVSLMGPEVGIETLGSRLDDLIEMYKHRSPNSQILFNYSANTTEWAIQRRFPLLGDGAGSPGTDLGFEIHCDICS
ncbi:hypothetical protein B0T16DRAFT_450679 [Cercophora newfieldiana]|uniref:Uncharacterized protein n=1 Tax=Cercophora newfieldiana TaxID=92897 RepID=A0AA39YM04_9PEZI|nr:hypothetical protein B0T16DRAFT_450679 [Cercophora newfieldiana]